jgi:energy-coupling factor transport system ATP-binding protein
VLHLEGVGYRYAGAQDLAIHQIGLRLDDGEVVGLVGASESGKTTVCLVAAGLAPRTIRGTLSGRLTIDGDDVVGWPIHRFASVVGIVFQDPATQLSGVCASVFEEVAFTPMNLGLPRSEVIERTWAALDDLRITGLAERDPVRLSGGQMQLVAIAGLLAMRPRHLVLDEPTAQLDPAGTTLVAEALAALAASGTSILVAEQKTDLLARICSRVAVIEHGRIVLDGATREVLADPRLEDEGVQAPSDVRLRRALVAAGFEGDLPDLTPA